MPGGRPLKWTSVEEIKPLIDAYFTTTPEREWTITGLALALDTSRETLMDYEGKDAYSDTIKRAKLKIHYAYEKDLRRQGRSGDIFALKNFGWRDKFETDVTTGGEKLSTPISNDAVTAIANEFEERIKKTLKESKQ